MIMTTKLLTILIFGIFNFLVFIKPEIYYYYLKYDLVLCFIVILSVLILKMKYYTLKSIHYFRPFMISVLAFSLTICSYFNLGFEITGVPKEFGWFLVQFSLFNFVLLFEIVKDFKNLN